MTCYHLQLLSIIVVFGGIHITNAGLKHTRSKGEIGSNFHPNLTENMSNIEINTPQSGQFQLNKLIVYFST